MVVEREKDGEQVFVVRRDPNAPCCGLALRLLFSKWDVLAIPIILDKS